MAEYEIEWTETIKKRARIQAPPNDDLVLDAAQELIDVAGTTMPRLIAWTIADNRPTDRLDHTFDITLVGKVEHVEHAGRKDKPAITEEKVRPL